MSYEWFGAQRHLFPDVVFPAHHLGITRSKVRGSVRCVFVITLLSFPFFGAPTHGTVTVTYGGGVQAFQRGEVFSLKTFIDANINRRPVYFDGKIGGYDTTDDAHERAYTFRPAGLSRLAVAKNAPPSIALPPAATLHEEWMRVRDYLTTPPNMHEWGPDTWENAVVRVLPVTYAIHVC